MARIVVADDDPDILTLIRVTLKPLQSEIIACADAEEALIEIQREAPDLVISDFMLPGISGIEFVKKVRALSATAETPILMVTGHTNYAMEGRAVAAGANRFLYKPFSPSQLRIAVQQLLTA
ncbi:MAG TPA: response regulator [Candidatus Dormibacteraeota bacterium]|nr:response regulator [Candidatus Dormibacteraeota bacterium]